VQINQRLPRIAQVLNDIEGAYHVIFICREALRFGRTNADGSTAQPRVCAASSVLGVFKSFHLEPARLSLNQKIAGPAADLQESRLISADKWRNGIQVQPRSGAF